MTPSEIELAADLLRGVRGIQRLEQALFKDKTHRHQMSVFDGDGTIFDAGAKIPDAFIYAGLRKIQEELRAKLTELGVTDL
jgi:hypothetical protein